MFRNFLIVFLCLLSFLSKAQYSTAYTPIAIADTVPASIKMWVDNSLDKMNESYAGISARAKFFKKMNKHTHDDIADAMAARDVYFDGPLYDYLNAVLNNILEANHLEKNVRLFPVRYTSPNAETYGNGTIFFHIGLLSRLENESQVAFVVCHELAHYYARHIWKNLDNYYTIISDDDVKAQVKKAAKQDYNSYKDIDTLLKKLSLKLMFHSRGSEMEADTAGFSLLLTTTYDPLAALRSMEILDSCDKNKYKDSIDIKGIFNCIEYPFKDRWLKYQLNDMWHESEDDVEFGKSDTLKSHPDCMKRKGYLKEKIDAGQISSRTGVSGVENNLPFDQVRQMADFELIEADYDHRNYGKSLFRTLLMLRYYPDNDYINAMVCKNLYFIHKYQKKHHLSDVIVAPYATFEKHYNDYLGFMQQLGLNDLAGLCYSYAVRKMNKYANSEEFNYAMLVARVAKGDTDPKALAETYIKQFPKGRMTAGLKEEFFPENDIKKRK